jgi:hypothetical protein
MALAATAASRALAEATSERIWSASPTLARRMLRWRSSTGFSSSFGSDNSGSRGLLPCPAALPAPLLREAARLAAGDLDRMAVLARDAGRRRSSSLSDKDEDDDDDERCCGGGGGLGSAAAASAADAAAFRCAASALASS